MRRMRSAGLLGATLLMASVGARGQEPPVACKFNLLGTWRQATDGLDHSRLIRFKADGVMEELSREGTSAGANWETASETKYQLVNPKAPTGLKLLPMSPRGGDETDPSRVIAMDITQFDDGSFTTSIPSNDGAQVTRWTRVDGSRYFVVLAAAKGTPGYGAPAFAMLVRSDGRDAQIDAFGLYETDPVRHYVIMGNISEEIQKSFEKEPNGDSAIMLRIEVAAGPFRRAREILKTWQRRARENTMLYQIPYLDNAVYLNQLVSSLNDCSQTIQLEKLTWRLDDPIITKQNLPQVPYFFIKDLRQRNAALHLSDQRFDQSRQTVTAVVAR